jgi:ribonuclease HI/probable phosphoglycerate mutase
MDRQSIIRRLAEQLTDEELQRIFPDTSAQTIRNLLVGTQKIISPQVDITGDQVKPAKLSSCKLFTDGASRGNPGQAGAGMVLLDDNGQELLTRAEYLGRCTNNVAEYKALILGLNSALEMGCQRLDVFMDSELIVRQITGRYKVKNAALKPLFTKTQGLLRRFKHFTITHIPRAKNARADELANQGIDETLNVENKL